MLLNRGSGRERHRVAAVVVSLPALACAFTLLCSCAAATGRDAMPSLPQVTPNGALFVAIAGQGASDSPDDPLIIRSRPVRVNLALLVDARVGQLIEANLFDDVDLSVELDNRDTAGSGSLVWTGHVVGVEGSQATFVLGGGQMAGDIVLPNAHYEIRYAEPDRYVIYQIDPTAFPPDEPPV